MSNNINHKYPTSRTLDVSPCNEDAQKAWCSERVPPSRYKTRSHVAASALMPFSSGRTIPLKWDDAERWISSPVSDGNVTSKYYSHHRKSHVAHNSQRRTKSNSGPLGSDGLLSYGSFDSYSPVLGMGVIHGGQWKNSVTIHCSADMGQVRFEDDLVGNCDQGGRKSCPGQPDWLELWSGPFIPCPQGELNIHNEIPNNEGVDTYDKSYNDEIGANRIIPRRDMSTLMLAAGEMSSNPSIVSSPKSMISTSYSPPLQLGEVCKNTNQYPESNMKDVQVDKHISTTPKFNLETYYNYSGGSSNSIVTNIHTKISKQQGEEVRIEAWENLQKAKAQAAIQKLEMELEKKRSSSINKIVEKLQKAEIKAQKMRSSLSKSDGGQIQRHATRSFSKLPLFCRKIRLRSSLPSCSTCYPF